MKLIIYTTFACTLLFNNVFAQHPNILISTSNNPNEPSITINPNNTDELVAGSNINNYYFSTDGGLNWSEGMLTSTYGVWGDPALACDTSGDFYFFHLSNPASGNWIDRIVCQKTNSPGGLWNNGTFAGLNGTKAQDKQWITVNRNNNAIYMSWTEFDSYGSSNPLDSSRILFSRSLTQGATWSNPVRLNLLSGDCLDSDNTTEGAVPAIGPTGEIYVSWAGPAGLLFDKSTDGGLTWLNQDIFVSTIPGGWDFTVPGIYRANGLPVTACDTSGGPFDGNIYINWSDQRNGINNTDIWLSTSQDGGNTWSTPVKVNDDISGNHQFFTWMTIDQVTGYLWFVFYDRRNYNDNRTDVYMARSTDGGISFQNFKISDSPFIPDAGIFFGDYTNLTAHNNIIRPIWTRLQNLQLSVYTALVDPTVVSLQEFQDKSSPLVLEQNIPNPFSDKTAFSFKLHESAVISLKIYDLTGRCIIELIHDEFFPAGKYIRQLENRLQSGTYFYEIRDRRHLLRRKMLVIGN
jgi:hypothetical protein